MKALIKVGYGCNENCTFCHTADVRHLEDTPERVAWKIDRAKRLGYSMVVLSGGEPTARPELLTWARRVAALGLDFSDELLTPTFNGRPIRADSSREVASYGVVADRAEPPPLDARTLETIETGTAELYERALLRADV